MKLINRDTDYAIRAIVYMAKEPEKLVTSQELFKKLNIPHAFIRRLLQKLARYNILTPYKGKGGGFGLKQDIHKIRLSALVKIFQGNQKITHCIFKKNICPNKGTCVLRKKLRDIEKKVIKGFDSITIASLLKKTV